MQEPGGAMLCSKSRNFELDPICSREAIKSRHMKRGEQCVAVCEMRLGHA